MTVNAIPTPTPFPIQFGQRDAKVIETATLAPGTISNKNLDATCTYDAAPVIAAGTVTNAMLAGSIAAAKMLSAPSHVVKYIRTGSTSATLSGVAIGDVCVHWTVADGLVNIKPATVVDTLPNGAPATGDYVIVIRAAS